MHQAEGPWAALARSGSFNAIHDASGFKIDVFIPPDTPFARRAMERRVRLPLPATGREIFVASPEDIVLQKLRWYRDGGESSQQQWRDVLGVIRLQAATLDGAYLREWSAVLAVGDLLERALVEAT